jgi:hypothetical protein
MQVLPVVFMSEYIVTLVGLNLHSQTFTKSTWLETALSNILNGSKSFDMNIKLITINITLS